MDKRFKNLGVIIAVIVIIAVVYVFVLPALDSGVSGGMNFKEGVTKLNQIVESKGVTIERFQEGKLFYLNDDGTVKDNFSDPQFLSLKNSFVSFKETLPAPTSSIDANALNQLTDLYIEQIELNQNKKSIFDDFLEIDASKDSPCSVVVDLRVLNEKRKSYEADSHIFFLDTLIFLGDFQDLDGIELYYLDFDSQQTLDEIVQLDEAIILLEDSCQG
ncbi:MAG: hypothetical protein ABIH20_03930 [Candidatus Diapherotrites archaeon]